MSGPRLMRPLAAASAALWLAGCMVGPDYKRPDVALPAAYPEAAADKDAAPPLTAEWWKLYGDARLNELVASALERNTDVKLAVARIEEADANLREANAAFLPEFDFNTNTGNGTARSRYSQITSIPLPPSVNPVHNNVRLAVTTSFEIDFWGKLRRGVEALRALSLGSRYAKDVVTLSLAGLTVQGYFSVMSLDAQIVVTRESLASRDETLRVLRARANAGTVSDLEVNQSVVLRANAAAQLADLLRQRVLAEHQLATLTGRLDLTLVAGDLRTLPVPPVPPPGLPSTLLERRPDVRQAETDLISNNAKIGVAKAFMLPTISITGLFGGESTALSSALGSSAGRVWSIGPNVFAPIFDAGRLAARTQQAEARQRQSLANYQKAIETAFREVADALNNLQQTTAAEDDLNKSADAARNALRLANLRYDAGYSAFFDVLDSQRSLNDAELAVLRNRQARLSASVDLMKAMGGGWSPDAAVAAR
ncbi:MAG: efflux transporter outer membrane subunit [Rhodospirillales bacterium]